MNLFKILRVCHLICRVKIDFASLQLSEKLASMEESNGFQLLCALFVERVNLVSPFAGSFCDNKQMTMKLGTADDITH